MKSLDHPFWQSDVVCMLAQFYQEGMAIEDISMCTGISITEVNKILDRIIPYLFGDI